MKTQVYQPINCNYYDELEAIAVKRREVDIQYLDQQGQSQTINTRILDFRTANKEEFAILENGMEIRLDYLVEVDGKPVILSC